MWLDNDRYLFCLDNNFISIFHFFYVRLHISDTFTNEFYQVYFLFSFNKTNMFDSSAVKVIRDSKNEDLPWNISKNHFWNDSNQREMCPRWKQRVSKNLGDQLVDNAINAKMAFYQQPATQSAVCGRARRHTESPVRFPLVSRHSGQLRWNVTEHNITWRKLLAETHHGPNYVRYWLH